MEGEGEGGKEEGGRRERGKGGLTMRHNFLTRTSASSSRACGCKDRGLVKEI